MDWKRVKSILIIALVCINIILGYTLYKDNELDKVESIDRDLVLSLLNTNNVSFDEALLEAGTNLPNISLKIQTYDREKSQKVFEEASDFSQLEFVYPETKINLGKQLSFNTSFDLYDSPDTEDHEITELAYELIDALGLSLDDLILLDIGRTDKKTILTFGQKVGSHRIRDSYMIIKYNNKNLLEFERVWYDVIASNDVEKDFNTPEFALFYFVRELYDRFPSRQRALSIDRLELVYELSQERTNTRLEDIVVEGEARIYWHIQTSDGESYFIEPTRE